MLINGKEYKIELFANLRGANLSGALLRSADLRIADLRSADLRGAYLRSADLRGADLRIADLSGANLSCANLRIADLSGANLSCANLRGADLSGADLSGANLGQYDGGDESAKVKILVGRLWRMKDQYEFFGFATDRGLIVKAGCRLFSPAHYRAHVTKEYAGTIKATETLAILAYLEARYVAYLEARYVAGGF